MTVNKQIEMARKLLASNPDGYARSMSGSIRSALSNRAANAFRAAITEDKTEHLFNDLHTSCPTATANDALCDMGDIYY